MKHLLYTLFLFLVSTTLVFSQNTTESLNIADFIAKRKVLYLTGNSLRTNLEAGDEYYRSVRMIVEYSGHVEIRPLPLGTIGAFIPERINENGLIIGKFGTSSKEWNDYNSINPSGIKLIITLNQALADKEIDKELLQPEYLKKIAKSFALVKKTNPKSTITPKCLVSALAQTYYWMDEFDKMDFIQSKAGELATIYYKQEPVGTLTSNTPELYADLLVKMGEYDFNNQSFPVAVKRIVGISENMKHLTFNQNIEIDEHIMRISPKDFQKNLDDEEEYNSKMGNTEIKMNSDLARVLAKSLTDDRTLILRLTLSPNAENSSTLSCENVLNANIYYSCKSATIYNTQMVKQVEGVFYLTEWW